MPTIEIEPDEADEALNQEIFEYLQKVAVELSNQLRVEAPVGATGDLQSSFQILDYGEQYLFVGSKLHYADDVQFGTGPHEPNFEKLQIWARRKLGNEAAAGPVFTKIKEEGTEANQYVDRAVANTKQHFQ